VTAHLDPDTYLSGDSGEVSGIRLPLVRGLQDAGLDALAALTATGPRLDRIARRAPARTVTVLSAYRPGRRLGAALGALGSERHRVNFALAAVEGTSLGKFQNLNRALRRAPAADWTLVVDDDVTLPRRFLDRFVGVCEATGLQLAQPAQTRRSHAAWRVTRRRPLSLVRRTRFVEIGPVTAFAAEPAAALLPFPDVRFGWGLDLHWAALAERHGWTAGIVDGTPVRHEDAPPAAAYGHEEAKAEAARFLEQREYLPAERAQETLAVLRR
jgi:hypothetical protein